MNADVLFLRERRQEERDRLAGRIFVVLCAVGAMFATHYLAFWTGGFLTLREVTARLERARPAYAAEPPKVDILGNENCIETMRACYARKRMGKVKP